MLPPQQVNIPEWATRDHLLKTPVMHSGMDCDVNVRYVVTIK
jgi:hypothetical protein